MRTQIPGRLADLFTSMGGCLLLYFAPTGGKLALMAVVVGFDTMTGIWAAIKSGGWAAYRSRRLFDIVPKIILYGAAILISYMIEDQLSGGQIPMLMLMSWVVVGIELKSCDENLEVILGYSLFGRIRDRLSKLKNSNP